MEKLNGDVTVLVPTRDRSDKYLRTALESIKRQTALNSIEKVIVSENGFTETSRLVCNDFRELNITYIKQPKPLEYIDHMYWLMDQPTTKYAAMLHDDDWWYPTHIESALKALSDDANAAYFSNFVFAKNEVMKGAVFHNPSIIGHFVKGEPDINSVSLNFSDIAAICYLFTPFHMSAMVAKTPFLKHANNDGVKHCKPWYLDRIIYPFLALYGNIIYNPQVLCGIRDHDTNTAKEIDNKKRYAEHAEGSVKIGALAATRQIDVINIWKGIYSSIPGSDWQRIASVFRDHFGNNNDNLFIGLPDTKRPVTMKCVLKQLLPYGLVNKFGR